MTDNTAPETGFTLDDLGNYDPTLDETDNSSGTDGPPRPIVWAGLASDEAEYEWLRLNEWVEDLRHTFALSAQIVPPFWHRHPLLVEHLSALHTHWLASYDPEQHGSAPFGWIRDLDEWKLRMREAVAMLGTRLDADRPHKLAPWPGEPEPDPDDTPPLVNLADRYDDFVTYILWWVDRRRALEDRYYAMIAETTASQDQEDAE
ncbi:MAG: hypothetical protein LBV00_12230 [Propionibacteriaceae bacterium]|jgi:hypothetical protein|nr:hypothetical protein [Propionibacteriaceae bacterium]